MQNESLRVPYVVVSSMLDDAGAVQNHVLTPFGSIEIRARKSGQGPGQSLDAEEVELVVELPLDYRSHHFFRNFSENLAEFSFGIAKRSMTLHPSTACIVELRLVGPENVLRMVRRPGAPAWATL